MAAALATALLAALVAGADTPAGENPASRSGSPPVGTCPRPATRTASAPAGRLLFDAERGFTWRNHFKIVAEPFGGRGKVYRARAGSDGRLKLTIVNKKGFFSVPPGADRWEVLLRLAVRGGRKLKVAVVGQGGRVVQCRLTAAAEGRWCTVRLPLGRAAGRIPAGTKVVDVTIWQQDGDRRPAMFVRSARLVRRASAETRPASGPAPTTRSAASRPS
jgi:hypothetical protein